VTEIVAELVSTYPLFLPTARREQWQRFISLHGQSNWSKGKIRILFFNVRIIELFIRILLILWINQNNNLHFFFFCFTYRFSRVPEPSAHKMCVVTRIGTKRQTIKITIHYLLTGRLPRHIFRTFLTGSRMHRYSYAHFYLPFSVCVAYISLYARYLTPNLCRVRKWSFCQLHSSKHFWTA